MFKCNGCGKCCQNIWALEGMEDFPYKAKKDGSCEKLVDNKCSIYETRPLICRVDDYFEKNIKGTMSKKAWYKLNNNSCIELNNR